MASFFRWQLHAENELPHNNSLWTSEDLISISSFANAIKGELGSSQIEQIRNASIEYRFKQIHHRGGAERIMNEIQEDERLRVMAMSLSLGTLLLGISRSIQKDPQLTLGAIRDFTQLETWLMKQRPDGLSVEDAKQILYKLDLTRADLKILNNSPSPFREGVHAWRSESAKWSQFSVGILDRYGINDGPLFLARYSGVLEGPQRWRFHAAREQNMHIKFWRSINDALIMQFGKDAEPYMEALHRAGLRGLGDLQLQRYQEALGKHFADRGDSSQKIAEIWRTTRRELSKNPRFLNLDQQLQEVRGLVIDQAVKRVSLQERAAARQNDFRVGAFEFHGRNILNHLGYLSARYDRRQDREALSAVNIETTRGLRGLRRQDEGYHFDRQSIIFPGETVQTRRKLNCSCKDFLKDFTRRFGILGVGVGGLAGLSYFMANNRDERHWAAAERRETDRFESLSNERLHFENLRSDLTRAVEKNLPGTYVYMSSSSMTEGNPATGLGRTIYALLVKPTVGEVQFSQREFNERVLNGILLRFRQSEDESLGRIFWLFDGVATLRGNRLAHDILGLKSETAEPFDFMKFSVVKAPLAFGYESQIEEKR